SELHPKPDWRPRYPGSGRLEGKVAIVTGGDSGIGRAVAVLFAREGANVAIAYLEEHDDAHTTREACEAEGAEVLLSAGDLGDPKHADGLVRAVIDRWGRLDVLVNNAGEQHPDKDVTEITPEQLQRTFQTNMFSMFYLVQAARRSSIAPASRCTRARAGCSITARPKARSRPSPARSAKISSRTASASTRSRRARSGPRSTRSAARRPRRSRISARTPRWAGPA